MAAGKINLQANDGAVIGLVVPDGLTSGERQIALGANLSNFASYHLIDGNLSVDNFVTQKAVDTFLYTGNTTTLPTINLGMDLESQWGDNTSETYGYIIEFKPLNAVGGWTKCNSINGNTKYLDSSSTAVEGTDANLFTLSTVAGNTTLNIGTSSRVNTNGVTYMVTVWQLTHRKTSVTSQGKTQIEHYNPTALETVIKYEGSGIAGHEIYHSLGRKLDFATIKNLSSATNWHTGLPTIGNNVYLYLNLTNAQSTDGQDVYTENNYITTASSNTNASGQQHILYGQANAYIDESGKLIGNCEIGVYNGTGLAGNKVLTKGMPYRFEIKRLDSTSDWLVNDNKRIPTTKGATYLNLSAVEDSSSSISLQIDGFTHSIAYNNGNASGGQYLYKVYYDTNANGGGSYYPKATDNANVQVNNALIPLSKGFDSNGVKNEIVISNETITGVTWEEGKNYPYKTDIGYGKSIHKPRYLKSELVRTYAGEQPDYFDVEKNKWFSCDAGSELVTNGDFSDGTTTGWTATNATLSVVSDRLQITRNGGAGLAGGQTINDLTIGNTYVAKFRYSPNVTGDGIYIADSNGNMLSQATTAGGLVESASGTFVARTTSITIYAKININGNIVYLDNISIFPVEITPTTEIPESRNYMNHIVHADSQGNPLFVEELPKVKYENVIKADEFRGKNACTAWVNFDGTTTPPTIRDSYNVSKVIRTATGHYDIYFEKSMNTLNFNINFTGKYYGGTGGFYSDSGTRGLNFVRVSVINQAMTAGFNNDSCQVQIFGGKN